MGINIDKFAPVGTKHCESKCDKKRISTKNGMKIVCIGCKRIIIEL